MSRSNRLEEGGLSLEDNSDYDTRRAGKRKWERPEREFYDDRSHYRARDARDGMSSRHGRDAAPTNRNRRSSMNLENHQSKSDESRQGKSFRQSDRTGAQDDRQGVKEGSDDHRTQKKRRLDVVHEDEADEEVVKKRLWKELRKLKQTINEKKALLRKHLKKDMSDSESEPR